MKITQRVSAVAVATVLCLAPMPAFAAVQLQSVVTSGITSPVFVTHAGDGTNRLFIVERAGFIRVLQPGSSTPSEFLNIQARVVSGNERGLLGLAFHPQYGTNGRFFVYYTRMSDGAVVIAEYTVSSNANVANTTEKVLFTVPHPNTNHNGGMLAFGPAEPPGGERYLYIAIGDGGGSNDMPNNAQTTTNPLGKILRINVNATNPVTMEPYTSPAENPFAGAGDPGDDRIYAFGFRNPWRFSFDRESGRQWVGDVGQDAWEEVDSPIVKGANYGWRVVEGNHCTTNDPSLCNTTPPPPQYIPPVLEYQNAGSRCAITGGYVYRGSAGVLAPGTYVYGDYCSGEIFTWNGTTSALLIDTALNISSFGEDAQGELYVVDLNGGVYRLTQSGCTFSINPTSQNFPSSGGTGSTDVTGTAGCGWNAVSNASFVRITSGASGTGNGTTAFSVDPNSTSSSRTGTMTVAGQTFMVTQSATTNCTFTITPTRANYGAGAVVGATVSVTAPAGCSWTAVSNAPSWITVTGGASGTGPGTVTYNVAAYTGKPKNRNGSITIAGSNFQVKQTR